MAKFQMVFGTTSQSILIFIQNSSSTLGAGLTGLVYNTSGLIAYYAYPRLGSGAITLATLAANNSAYSSGGFKEVDSANMPGWYRFDIPDTIISGFGAGTAGSSRTLALHFMGAFNMAPCPNEIELTGWNNQDNVHGGMSALPNVAASAVGGLPVAVDTSGRVDVLKISGTTQTARDLGASVLLSAGTGTGQLDFTSGVVKANLVQILATALTETAGQIAGAFKKLFDVAAPSLTCLDINQTGDSYARLGAPAGASIAADIATRSTYAGADTAGTTTLLTRIPGTVQPQTGDSYARIGAPAGASVSADVAALKTDVDGGVKLSVGTGAGQVNVSGGKVPATVAAADVSGNPAVNAAQLGGQTVTAAAGVTVPSSIASPTNITAGTLTTVTNLTNAPTAGDFTAAMKTSLNAATPVATLSGDLTPTMKTSVTTAATAATPTVTAGTVSDKTGYSLTAGEHISIAADAQNGLTAQGYTTARAGYLDTLSGLVVAIWAYGARTLTAFGFSVTTSPDPNVALIKAKTDNLPASPAAVSDIPTANANADALLKRDWTAISGEASRSVLNALRFLRNKWWIAPGTPGTLTVCKEDDSTVAFTGPVTTDHTADPVTGVDPT